MNTMMIVFLIWLIGILITYTCFARKWDKTLFEKIYLSFVWTALILLYVIHLINKL